MMEPPNLTDEDLAQYFEWCAFQKKFRVDWGSTSGISFITSEGIKTLKPGKRYDADLNEIPDGKEKR